MTTLSSSRQSNIFTFAFANLSFKKAIIVFTALVFTTAFSGCAMLSKPKEPKISVAGIKINNINMTRVRLDVDLDIFNPNAKDINVKEVNYGLYLGKNKLLADSFGVSSALTAGEETRVTVPLFINVFDALNVVRPFLQADRNPVFTFKGDVKIKGYPLPLKFSQKQELNLDDPRIKQFIR